MPLLLTTHDIATLLDRIDVLGAVTAIHDDLGAGRMTQPAPHAMPGGDEDGVFLPMTARSDRLGLVAVKLLGDLPGNAERGLPTQRSTIMVADAVTGSSVAVLDGALITRYRTAAASALATRVLARSGSTTLGLVGAGALAVRHAVEHAAPGVMDLQRIVVWSRSSSTTDRFLDGVGPELAARTVVVDSPERVVAESDVVCTLTPATSPVVRGAWLRPGQLVSAVGARPRPTHRELDGAAMAAGRVVVDDVATARAKSGDLLVAIEEGAVPADLPLVTLGEVVAGRAPGRTTEDAITVFDSVGLAAQDLALAARVIELARAEGVGTDLQLSAVP